MEKIYSDGKYLKIIVLFMIVDILIIGSNHKKILMSYFIIISSLIHILIPKHLSYLHEFSHILITDIITYIVHDFKLYT